MSRRVPFVDLQADADVADVRDAINRVVRRGWFVLGPEVEAFELEFAQACGASFAIGVANGTDAIALLLRAIDIGAGDEVIVPAMTAAFTALAVTSVGARPVIVDIDPARMTIDPAAAEAAITPRTRAIIPVHLYGQPADLDALSRIAERHRLALVEDCCQAHLATANGRPVGTRGIGGAFSFYPTKNLGALGDGGAVVTNDLAMAERIRRLRNGGQASRYQHVECGVNSRLDELQAAVLGAKLRKLAAATARRRRLARLYREQLPHGIGVLREFDPGHVYHLFAIRTAARDRLQEGLARAGIETLIHYPAALPEQPAFASFAPDHCPEASRAARELLSLPLHHHMPNDHIIAVTDAVSNLLKDARP